MRRSYNPHPRDTHAPFFSSVDVGVFHVLPLRLFAIMDANTFSREMKYLTLINYWNDGSSQKLSRTETVQALRPLFTRIGRIFLVLDMLLVRTLCFTRSINSSGNHPFY